ncbi:MAG TPA: amidohydrolase family protein, partial [Cyclobacteriaceae bacterium]|nr:amidohydrolase family protein [Cyclobacteriaceae bacterium]HNH60184.1 amidohydrolase family protein [Cyclobacteriaceae bacterium]
MRLFSAIVVCIVVILFIQAAKAPSYDIIIRQGTIYDGSGSKPFVADVGIRSDTIAFIGDLSSATAKTEIDAKGLSVAPGFINMLSMAERSLLMDGRSMSDIMQGVTLEVMGEGWSAGPVKRKSNKPVDSLWTTLDGYFKWQMKKGTSTNVASFVGATTIRNYVLGHANRKPTAAEQEQMNKLVQEAMEQGAMGVSTSLIYAPADFASTEEIISLASEAARYKGMYITHMRSESDNILKALNETFRVAREANIRAEIYHLKINHDRNWNKIEQV